MKKEIIGYVRHYPAGRKSYWTFETDRKCYGTTVVNAIDELCDIWSKSGNKFKITIEQLN